MIVAPDFSEAVELTPIQPGVYKTRIVDVEQKTSRKGDAYLQWKLQIFGATGEFSKFNNLHVRNTTMLTGKGAGRLKELALAALGKVPAPFDTNEFIGRELLATIVPETDQAGNKTSYVTVKSVRSIQ
jgi:Protein of unknown function (DUF669)